MTKLFRIILLAGMPLFYLNAQVPIQMGVEVDNMFLRAIEAKERNGESGDNPSIKGTSFLHSQFEDGEVLTDKAHYQNVKVRYNILNDEFHFRAGSQIMILEPKMDLKMVKVKNAIYAVKTFEFKSRRMMGFLEQHVDGKYSLFSKKNISIRPAKPPQALSTEPIPAKYIRQSDTFYLEMPDGKLTAIKNGKDLVAMFKNSSLQAEAKDQKISLKKDEHLPALVQLVNEMKL